MKQWQFFLFSGLSVLGANVAERGAASHSAAGGELRFERAAFFKPLEGSQGLSYRLAPLLLQEVTRDVPLDRSRFGALVKSGEKWGTDEARPTVYYAADVVQIGGRTHARMTYTWWYSRINKNQPVSPLLVAQGVRLTLNSAGHPVIWEILWSPGSPEPIFVARSLEKALLAEGTRPLVSQRFGVEKVLTNQVEGTCPRARVVVPRLIDDAPEPMGPMVYLDVGQPTVSTLICRCMPAEAGELVSTITYELQPWRTEFAEIQAQGSGNEEPWAFWPDGTDREKIEEKLRLPNRF